MNLELFEKFIIHHDPHIGHGHIGHGHRGGIFCVKVKCNDCKINSVCEYYLSFESYGRAEGRDNSHDQDLIIFNKDMDYIREHHPELLI